GAVSNMFGSGMPDLSSETNMVSGTNMGSAESEIHQLPQDLGNMLMNELGVGVFNNDMNEVITTNYAYGFGQSVTTSSTSSTSGFVPPQAQQGPSTTIPPGTGPPPRAAPAPSSGEYSVSPTNSVVAYNNAVAGWFLTCPTPSQNGAMGMASTEPATKSIGGNACVNMDSSLVSSLILHARTYNFIFEPEWTQLDGVEPFNFAQLFTTVYAYSPQVDGELSNGFSTRSYIFDSVPSFAQHALWSWTAPYVDLTQALTPKLTYYVNPLGQLTWGQCTYGYTYQMYDVLDWIKNTAIPFDYANTVTGNSWASTGGQGTPTGSSTTGTGSGSVVQTAVAPSPQGIFGSGAIPTTSIAPAAFAGSNPAGTPAGTKSKNNNGFGIQYEPVLPYLFFNWNITFSPQTSYTTPNLTSPTEGVFTPLTYGGAINAIEPYPIDINGVMIANFSPDNGKTYNAFAFNNSGIAINLSSNTAIIGTQGYGLVSVASTPNDYIYLLLSQKNSDTTSYYIAIARAITKGYYQSPTA
ncbi:MAG: hypothetical protein M1321_00210, partial [Candidatus Marsarchaeota archaeon]|nr:hypothetical protein [Candidatus Marsarchaeota archaeon]